jgi:hypothetical protein
VWYTRSSTVGPTGIHACGAGSITKNPTLVEDGHGRFACPVRGERPRNPLPLGMGRVNISEGANAAGVIEHGVCGRVVPTGDVAALADTHSTPSPVFRQPRGHGCARPVSGERLLHARLQGLQGLDNGQYTAGELQSLHTLQHQGELLTMLRKGEELANVIRVLCGTAR